MYIETSLRYVQINHDRSTPVDVDSASLVDVKGHVETPNTHVALSLSENEVFPNYLMVDHLVPDEKTAPRDFCGGFHHKFKHSPLENPRLQA